MPTGITAMAWSLEEKLLVVGTQEGMVAVWDMEEQQVIHILTGHRGKAQEVGSVINFFLTSLGTQSVPRAPSPVIHFSVSKPWPLFLHQLAIAT